MAIVENLGVHPQLQETVIRGVLIVKVRALL